MRKPSNIVTTSLLATTVIARSASEITCSLLSGSKSYKGISGFLSRKGFLTMARRYLPAQYVKSPIADNARMKGNDMERLMKKIDCIKMQAQIYDYLVSELYPVPECNNCEYNFTRLSNGKCFKCDGVSQFVLAKGIQADIRRMARGITKITNNRYDNSNEIQS